MYRAYVNYSSGVRLTSNSIATKEEACKLLDRLLDLPDMADEDVVTGGDVEVKVGKKWVRAELDEESKSIIFGRNSRVG